MRQTTKLCRGAVHVSRGRGSGSGSGGGARRRAFVVRKGLSICSFLAFARSFSDCSMLRSFNSTYLCSLARHQ